MCYVLERQCLPVGRYVRLLRDSSDMYCLILEISSIMWVTSPRKVEHEFEAVVLKLRNQFRLLPNITPTKGTGAGKPVHIRDGHSRRPDRAPRCQNSAAQGKHGAIIRLIGSVRHRLMLVLFKLISGGFQWFPMSQFPINYLLDSNGSRCIFTRISTDSRRLQAYTRLFNH